MSNYPVSARLKARLYVCCAGLLYLPLSLAQTPNEVTTCGITFDLPSHLRITKPKRTINDEGVAECEFRVVRRGAHTERQCRDKEEGGSPPYKICDWYIYGLHDDNVVVAQTNLSKDHKQVGRFRFEDGRWQHIGYDERPTEDIDVYGKPGFMAETYYRGWWYRATVKDFQTEHAGSYGDTAILVQLTPSIAVAMEPPPADDDAGECKIFCSSLRPAVSKRP